MLGRVVSRVLVNASRHVGRQTVRAKSEVTHKSGAELAVISRCTLNDLSIPSGSFYEHYAKRNARWNIQLAVSACIFLSTCVAMVMTNVTYLHNHPALSELNIDPSRPIADEEA